MIDNDLDQLIAKTAAPIPLILLSSKDINGLTPLHKVKIRIKESDTIARQNCPNDLSLKKYFSPKSQKYTLSFLSVVSWSFRDQKDGRGTILSEQILWDHAVSFECEYLGTIFTLS